MIVGADTSPIVALSNLDCISLLHDSYDQIVVPPDVIQELRSELWSKALRDLADHPPPWLAIRSASKIAPIEGLHAGESAAIALALELQADRLLIDEMDGRAAAVQQSLRVLGTVGVLVAAAQRDLVNLEDAFRRLQQTGFRITQELLDEQLQLFRAWQAAQPS